ncbi:hypothetical protein QQF64_029823 [Cirrhinus molitorella]|uniref:Uncharacterized protein n=1 Tax=Cirrhinus molitorella TaxID=172907 RepID=A0ABR3N1V3_9TELE
MNKQRACLTRQTTRKLVNILCPNMVVEEWEQYYDPRSGQGYIAYRLKTVQRNSVSNLKGASKVVCQDGPKTLRETSSTTEQLSGWTVMWQLFSCSFTSASNCRKKEDWKISATEAAEHAVKFKKPFLLCVGEKRSSIQKFYIILDQKAIPCMTQTAVAAFDELINKAHFVIAVSMMRRCANFYTISFKPHVMALM